MLQIGVQSQNVIEDDNPQKGFELLKRQGFDSVDFSLNEYLVNSDIYQSNINNFFDKSIEELEAFFAPHKQAAQKAGIRFGQMHMPYPIYVPNVCDDINNYLWNVVAPKSMQLCAFFKCPYIVIHGFKLAYYLGSEEAEWAETERFIHSIALMAKELGITICIENLYEVIGNHLVEGPCCNVSKVNERIDRINKQYDAEVLGFCFDTGHANLVGIDFEGFITELGNRLKVLHIHDNDGISDLHQIPFTFTKTRDNVPTTDWNGFISGLKNIGFNNVLSFETAPVLKSFPIEMKEPVLMLIAQIGKYFSLKF